VRKADNVPPSCVGVTKSGNLNFLEPSGHLGSVKGLIFSYVIETSINNASIMLCIYLKVEMWR